LFKLFSIRLFRRKPELWETIMKDRNQLEAQYWWAFACLALAGQRQVEEFHAELLNRCAGRYPTTEEVNRIMDEACCFLSVVLNSYMAKCEQTSSRPSGWQRHLVALSRRPD
jgi:hypothetical protein